MYDKIYNVLMYNIILKGENKMKKLLSLLLLLSLFTLCFTLASCGGNDDLGDDETGAFDDFKEVSTDDIEKDPVGAISQAFSNSTKLFFVANQSDSVFSALTNALDNGAIELSFDSETLLGSIGLSNIGGTFYFDDENDRVAFEAGVTVGQEQMGGVLFFDENGIKAMSQALFGSNQAYAINFDTLISKLPTSPFGDLADEFADFLEIYGAEVNAFMESFDFGDFIDKLLQKLNPTVSEKTITIGEDEYDCVVVSYEITNKTIEALVNTAISEFSTIANLGEEEKAFIEDFVGSYVEMINGVAQIDCSVDFCINSNISTLVQASLTGKVEMTIAGPGEEYLSDSSSPAMMTTEVDINVSQICTAKELKLSSNVSYGGEPLTSSISLSRNEEDGVVTYKLLSLGTEISGESGQTTEFTALDLNATYTKESGALSIKVSIPANEGSGNDNLQTFELTGSLNISEDGAKFTFTSVKIKEMTIQFALVIDIKDTAKMPSVGTAIDIMNLTEAEFEALFAAIMNSPLGDFFDF